MHQVEASSCEGGTAEDQTGPKVIKDGIMFEPANNTMDGRFLTHDLRQLEISLERPGWSLFPLSAVEHETKGVAVCSFSYDFLGVLTMSTD